MDKGTYSIWKSKTGRVQVGEDNNEICDTCEIIGKRSMLEEYDPEIKMVIETGQRPMLNTL